MSYPTRQDFMAAHERMAPPRKKEQRRRQMEAAEQQDARAIKTIDALNGLTFEALRTVNVTRCVRWHPPTSEPWTCADWSNAVCGEAGELANVVKKIRRHDTGAQNKGDPSKPELIGMAAAELADVVIYCDLLAHHFGINLADAIKEKFNRVSKKYGFPERLGSPSPPSRSVK